MVSKSAKQHPVGRRERRRTETRERIFRTAMNLFMERGFAETTIEDITEAADTGKGTFFNYFRSKEHVLAAFGELQKNKVRDFVEGAVKSGRPMNALLSELGLVLAEEPGKTPDLFRNMMLANIGKPEVRVHFARAILQGRRKLAELMAYGQRRGEIRDDLSPEHLARTFQRAFFGTMVMWCISPTTRLTECFAETFAVLWPGVRATATQKKQRTLRMRGGSKEESR